MLVSGDLGFPSLLLVLLFFPVIGLLVRRKWRLSIAKEEEIRRLLVLASEEAARAELEASIDYSDMLFSPPPPPPRQSRCALCYSPTTTRCSRCKAVRYCSGKCQIIHWRQGHKDQCHPPSTDYQNDQGSKFSCRVVKQECFDRCEPEGRNVVKSVVRPSEKPAFTKSTHSSEVLCREDDRSQCLPPSDETRSKSMSKSLSASTEFVPAAASNESLVDASVEIISSKSPGRSIGHQRADISSDKHETPSIRSVDSFTSFTASSVEEAQSGSNSSSDSEIDPDTCSCDSFSTGLTGFSRGALDGNADDTKSNFSGPGDHKSSDEGAFLRFSFNLSGNVTPPFAYGSEPKPATDCVSKVKTMPSLSTIIDRHESKSREVSSQVYSESSAHTSSSGGNSITKNSLGDNCLLKLKAKRSEHVVSSMSGVTHLLKSREVEPLCSTAPYDQPSSDTGRCSLSSDNDHSSVSISHYPQNSSNGLKTSVLKVVDHIRPSKLSKQYQGLFPYELFVKLYNLKKVELRPCGLTNCGNSCYANVVLQCLAFTPPLTAYLLQRFHSKACGKSEWCFTCEFESLTVKAKEGKSPLAPIAILSQLGRISSTLSNGKEEDAHEFLRYVIDTMQSVCLKEAGINGPRLSGEETTLIGLTFGGYLRSKIRCMKCRGKSEQHERMMDLTLEIEGNIGSLEEALRKFTGTEMLDGENKYKCSRCKSYEIAKKKFTILEAPNVLTIALKRFQSGKFGKLNKSIRFPETLDLTPYMSRTSDKSPIYSLYCVVVHVDIMNAAFSGHYVCYVKNSQNKWFKIDDSTVKAVERERVLAEGAYMLLYARCSPRVPKSIQDTMMSRDGGVRIPHEAKNYSSRSRLHGTWIPFDGPPSAIRRIFDLDSASDDSSLISGSDEGSCSTTESNRDSSSTDDFSEYIFGESGHGWNSPYRASSLDPDASLSSSSSSSSLNSGPLKTIPQAGISKQEDAEGKGRMPNSCSDTTKCRKLASNASCRETDSECFGRDNPLLNPRNIRSSVSFRR